MESDERKFKEIKTPLLLQNIDEEEKLSRSSIMERPDLSSTNVKHLEEYEDDDLAEQGEEDFIQWVARLLIES